MVMVPVRVKGRNRLTVARIVSDIFQMKTLSLGLTFLIALSFAGCGRSPESDAPQDAKANAPKPNHAHYSLQWVSNDIPATMGAGKSVAAHVSVKNTGDWEWPDPFAANPSAPNGTYAVRLSYGWVGSDGK